MTRNTEVTLKCQGKKSFKTLRRIRVLYQVSCKKYVQQFVISENKFFIFKSDVISNRIRGIVRL